MLASEVVDKIRCLLSEGQLSQRAIARLLGVNRGTVSAIALGRGRYDELSKRRRSREEVPPPSGCPRRCPECGALVQMPCVACRVREILRHRRRPPHNGEIIPASPRHGHITRRESVRPWYGAAKETG